MTVINEIIDHNQKVQFLIKKRRSSKLGVLFHSNLKIFAYSISTGKVAEISVSPPASLRPAFGFWGS